MAYTGERAPVAFAASVVETLDGYCRWERSIFHAPDHGDWDTDRGLVEGVEALVLGWQEQRSNEGSVVFDGAVHVGGSLEAVHEFIDEGYVHGSLLALSYGEGPFQDLSAQACRDEPFGKPGDLKERHPGDAEGLPVLACEGGADERFRVGAVDDDELSDE